MLSTRLKTSLQHWQTKKAQLKSAQYKIAAKFDDLSIRQKHLYLIYMITNMLKNRPILLLKTYGPCNLLSYPSLF